MKNSNLIAMIIVNLVLILAIVFIPFWWLKIIPALVLAAIWITKIAISMLRFQHEKLKRWFPKHKWMIQRLHEKYIYEHYGFTKTELADLQKHYLKFVERAQKAKVARIPTFLEWSLSSKS